jgi:hypothetical protein
MKILLVLLVLMLLSPLCYGIDFSTLGEAEREWVYDKLDKVASANPLTGRKKPSVVLKEIQAMSQEEIQAEIAKEKDEKIAKLQASKLSIENELKALEAK